MADPRTRALRFALRPPVVAKYLAQMLGMLGLLCIVPAVVCAADGHTGPALRFAAVIVALGLIAITLGRLDCKDDLQTNEALAITALVFIIPSGVLAWPLAAYGLAPVDAWFEATSGVTTTGLSTLGSVEALPYSFHFARAWMQWVGGLGIVVLALALLLHPGTTAARLGFDRREADDLAGGTRAYALRVLAIYSALTGVGIALLWWLLSDPGDAVVHVLAAVSTGGFSSHDRSLAGLAAPGAAAALLALSLLAAAPFYVYSALFYRRWRTLFRDRQVRTLLACAGVVAAALFVLMPGDAADGPVARAGEALAMALSAQTTAGFSTLPVSALGNAAQLMLLGAMLVGGALGSTAGGIKTLRFLLLLKLARLLLQRATTARATVLELRLGDERIGSREVEETIGVVTAFGLMLFVSWGAFLAAGHPPLASLFDVCSALTTSGLSTGVTAPGLEPGLKILLGADMLMGRVEVVAVLLLLLPATWIGRRREAS